MRNIDFYYFSGTGNTLLVVRRMAEVLARRGIGVRLIRLDRADPTAASRDRAIGLAFPVAGQSTYPFVWDFIRALPPADKTPVFMVDTLAGFSGGIVGPLKKFLESRGYVALGAEEIIMPANLFYVYPPGANSWLVARGLRAAEGYANRLADGATRWGRMPILSDLVFGMFWHGVRRLWLSQWCQRKYRWRLDPTRCTKCGLCVRLCPVGNIRLPDYPEFGTKCNYCLKCVSWCPAKAIPCRVNCGGRTYTAAGLKVSDMLAE